MQKLLRLFLFFFFSICGFAQNNISLSYMFLDTNTQLPIESATVFFFNVEDSTIIDYTSTDKNGSFKILTRKNYALVILKN